MALLVFRPLYTAGGPTDDFSLTLLNAARQQNHGFSHHRIERNSLLKNVCILTILIKQNDSDNFSDVVNNTDC